MSLVDSLMSIKNLLFLYWFTEDFKVKISVTQNRKYTNPTENKIIIENEITVHQMNSVIEGIQYN